MIFNADNFFSLFIFSPAFSLVYSYIQLSFEYTSYYINKQEKRSPLCIDKYIEKEENILYVLHYINSKESVNIYETTKKRTFQNLF